ncbi:probable NAD(P)H dehydrogenase subunit CRR3, chloroplastic [Diospyros lotus]|uniref:probable NAD(P)H dehydrogenase subunit CRR3, chloroplastic n=1 Tax=Diospyros lotus TaxID=55363 RepID=UPI002255FC6A|nr:probable NAD(P)H dehydrogenase subunit CRR3, chloroplastic [Diospyros lotus]
MMHCLTTFSFSNKPQILCSFSNNTNPKPPTSGANTAIPTTEATNHLHPKQKLQRQNQPSVAEIERAIGAGVFRDRDTSNRNSEQRKTLFDSILSNSIRKSEGSVERRLRETGEWIIDRTEKESNSAGKSILMAVFQWILPIWILSFLVASGIIKLPFSIPLLDDLIM